MKNIDTLCVRAGYKPKNGETNTLPIYQSTTYFYESGSELADLFDLKKDGHIYSRLSNPTNSALESKLAALEGGKLGIACSSGQSAMMVTLLNICFAGDNIVCSSAVYGGTHNLLNVTLRKYGIEARFISPEAPQEEIEKLIDDKTKAIIGETIANPAIVILDFEKFSAISKKYGILFIVDNTLATPALVRPVEYGANIIIHSTSKYLDGHAVALGGAVIDCANFEFKGNPRYPEFNKPDNSYHGLVYADLECPFGLKAKAQMIRDLGSIMSPQNAFLTHLGCETLALRMERHCSNASKVAEFLEASDKIEWVKYPTLKSSTQNELQKKYMPKGCGGMMSFGVKGGREKAQQFMENLEMISIVTHVADVRSCVLHPASTTHRQLSSEALIEAGISDNLIRLSVGIENVEDIICDLKQSLDRL